MPSVTHQQLEHQVVGGQSVKADACLAASASTDAAGASPPTRPPRTPIAVRDALNGGDGYPGFRLVFHATEWI
nr:unnamed protein product [Digitaria exilis]